MGVIKFDDFTGTPLDMLKDFILEFVDNYSLEEGIPTGQLTTIKESNFRNCYEVKSDIMFSNYANVYFLIKINENLAINKWDLGSKKLYSLLDDIYPNFTSEFEVVAKRCQKIGWTKRESNIGNRNCPGFSLIYLTYKFKYEEVLSLEDTLKKVCKDLGLDPNDYQSYIPKKDS